MATFQGTVGSDSFIGGADDDNIVDELGGDDQLEGQGGADFIYVQRGPTKTGSVLVDGGADNDRLIYYGDGAPTDTAVSILGGDGDDFIQTTRTGMIDINAGSGDDIIEIDHEDGSYTITLGAGRDVIFFGRDFGVYALESAIVLTDFATGAGGDRITVDLFLDRLVGWDSTLNPFATGHLILEQRGADAVIRINRDGIGDDAVDFIIFEGVQTSALTAHNIGFATDGGATSGDTFAATGIPIGYAFGTGGDDTITGTAMGDEIYGGAGDDLIHGGDNFDILQGGFGDDILYGDAGSDRLLDYTDGNEEFYGGDGSDWLYVERQMDSPTGTLYLDGGDGDDRIEYFRYVSDPDDLTVIGGAGNDYINLYPPGTGLIDAGDGDDELLLRFYHANYSVTLGPGSDLLRFTNLPNNLDAAGLVRVADFASGAAGDVLRFDQINDGNPFETGELRLAQRGDDTVLQYDRDGGERRFETFLVLENLDAASLTTFNLDGLAPGRIVLLGTDGDDDLAGDGSANTLDGAGGNDRINGAGDDDTIDGGDGDDTLDGGAGTDSLSGGAGNDTYWVDSADVVTEASGEGADRVFARASFALGADASIELIATADYRLTDRVDLTGNALNNAIIGSNGVNVLRGGDGDDTLRGLGGTDTLDGGAGVDQMFGGADNDSYYVTSGDRVFENAGEGLDSVYARASFALTTGAEVEVLATADWRLTHRLDLTGNELNNAVTGNSGVNVLRGGGGGDTLRGLGGHDTLDGGAGIDQLFGGAGDDSYHATAGDQIIELAGEGYDRVYAQESFALAAGSAVELLGTADWRLTERLDLAGNEYNNAITGNSGVNLLYGRGGSDTLRGLAGNDTLDGGDDGDILIGGAGDDNYYVTGGDQVVELAGEGFDSVYARASFGLGAGSAVELLGTVDWRATTAIDLTGNELANSVTGNNGVNSLGGLAGNDTLRGMGGNDTLDGGAGRDTLYGGEGDDIFAFTTALGGDQVDHLADFDAAHDTIALDDARFAGLGLGALAASAFKDGSAALDADDRIIYDQAAGRLWFDADGSGAGAQVLFATLSAGTALTAADFMVI